MKRRKRLKEAIEQIIFTGPAIFIFTSVIVTSFVFGVYLTFTNWDGLSKTVEFVGIYNYSRIIRDTKFWTSMWITIKYVCFSLIIVNVLAFFIAYLLTSGIKGQTFFRSCFFSPQIIGGIILGMLWNLIFSNVIPRIGDFYNIGILKISWIANEKMAFWALVVGFVWQYTGYMMMIYIAGFTNIPKELLEASSIDGANGVMRLKHIIIPFMMPSFVICLFFSVQRGFMVYDVNLSLTNGGPYRSTELISMNVYQKAFLERDYGGGQAAAFFLFLLVVIVTVSQTYFLKKKEVEA